MLLLPSTPAIASAGEDAAADNEIIVTAHAFREGEIGKSDIPLLETPQAISVVTAEQIKDRGITDINDALRGVAGVSFSTTYGFYDAFTIRGYDTTYDSLYLDGLTLYAQDGANNELSGLERVEVLKGPASMLYGAGPIGGVVNLVSKRPQNHAFLDATLSTGSWGHAAFAVDANAPLNSEGTLLARINVVYRDEGSYIANGGKNRLFIAPALTWKPGPDTNLTILGRWQRDRDNPFGPVPAEGTVLPNANGPIPYRFAMAFPGDQRPFYEQDRKSIGYIFDHKISDAISFSQTLRYSTLDQTYNNWLFSADFTDSAYVDGVQQGHIIGLYNFGVTYGDTREFGVDSRLSAQFDTGPISHQMLFGIDYREDKTTYRDTGSSYDGSVNFLDYLNPDYTLALQPDPANAYTLTQKGHRTGIYVQDHVGFNDRLFLTIGGRWDEVVNANGKDNAFSPRVGVNWLIAPKASIYASWSKSFAPQFSWITAFDGTSLPNGQGRNIELGMKFGGNRSPVHASLAIFDLERTNVPTSDPMHDNFYVVTGKQRSRGLEMEGVWTPSPGWNFSAAYTWLNGKVVADNDIPVGTRLGNVPRHNLYVHGAREMQDGPLAGLGASLSLMWNSAKVADTSYFQDIDGDGINDADFRLPGYVVVDAGLSYKVADWALRLSINNLFDKQYYPQASNRNRVTIGEPRSWRLSLSRRF